MASTRTTRSEAAATANDRGGKNTAHAVAAADVAQRAYDLYLARGRADGHDVEDWLQAERELRGVNDKS
jgi:hypothetical protein